jgi:hypothetical protein
MSRLAQLLGSSTRANIVELLASANKPLSAYRVSKMYNMNMGKVYSEMKKLASLGLVSTTTGNKGLEYALVDDNLRELALKLSPRVINYDDWSSQEARAQRFRSGMIKVPKFSIGKPSKSLDSKPTRMPGELDALALLARSKFDKKYLRIGDREYARI